MLLRLSLLFPDRAPDRLRLALRAGSTRELVRAGGATPAAGEAARKVLALLARTARHDRGTRRHSERVRAYVDLLAEALRLPVADLERLRWAALVHDVGKTACDPGCCASRAAWTRPSGGRSGAPRRGRPAGRRAAPVPRRRGSTRSASTTSGGTAAATRSASPASEISYGARIVAVADAFEVMTAHRSYKRPIDPGSARAELVRCGGTQFDPDVVRAMLCISLERLRRVLGPAAWLGVVATTARPDLDAVAHAGSDVDLPEVPPDAGLDDALLGTVGLHPASSLWAGASTHPAAVPTGHDAAGSGKLTGHVKAGAAGSHGGPDQQ